MRRFELHRDEDVSGMSGTGVVAQGVVFDDGTVALRWLTARRSTALYDSILDLELIHSRDGRTRVVFLGVPSTFVRVMEAARKVRDDADPMGGVRRGVIRFDESGDSSNDVTIGRGPHGTLLMANANDMQELHDALLALDTSS